MDLSATDVPRVACTRESTSYIGLTITNRGESIVRECRTVHLRAGLNRVDFTGVPAELDPRSVNLRSITDPHGTRLLEQRFCRPRAAGEGRLWSGAPVTITTLDGTLYTGRLLRREGTSVRALLTENGVLLLQDAAGELTFIRFNTVREIRLVRDADDNREPALQWLVQSALDGPQQVEIHYMTEGLSWAPGYTVLLAANSRALSFHGGAEVINETGVDFLDAAVTLTHRPTPPVQNPSQSPFRRFGFNRPPEPPPPRDPPAQIPLAATHIDIERPLDIPSGLPQEIAFTTGLDLPAAVGYVYDASMKFERYPRFPYRRPSEGLTAVTEVDSWLEFEANVPVTLPAGKVRVYQAGAADLLGEDEIGTTLPGMPVRLSLGPARGLRGTRTQAGFRLISQLLAEEDFEIVLTSSRAGEDVIIRVTERMFRWSDWEILSASHEYRQMDERGVEFRVRVPAGGETRLTYLVRYMWPANISDV